MGSKVFRSIEFLPDETRCRDLVDILGLLQETPSHQVPSYLTRPYIDLTSHEKVLADEWIQKRARAAAFENPFLRRIAKIPASLGELRRLPDDKLAEVLGLAARVSNALSPVQEVRKFIGSSPDRSSHTQDSSLPTWTELCLSLTDERVLEDIETRYAVARTDDAKRRILREWCEYVAIILDSRRLPNAIALQLTRDLEELTLGTSVPSLQAAARGAGYNLRQLKVQAVALFLAEKMLKKNGGPFPTRAHSDNWVASRVASFVRNIWTQRGTRPPEGRQMLAAWRRNAPRSKGADDPILASFAPVQLDQHFQEALSSGLSHEDAADFLIKQLIH